MILKSPAKINLFLNILGKRDDGFHEIQTFFQFINLYDQITISETSSKNIIFTSNNSDIDPKNNLCLKAVEIFQEKIGNNSRKNVEIFLEKNIPVGAGLGGGSSNAASILTGLNQLWACNLSKNDLANMGEKLGADVPAFINGVTSYATGIGNNLQNFSLENKFFLVVYPLINVSTAKMYQKYLPESSVKQINIENIRENIGFNSFEPLLCEEYPEIKETLSIMRKNYNGYVSGSGSCLFSIFDKEEDAKKAQEFIPKSYQTYIVHSINNI